MLVNRTEGLLADVNIKLSRYRNDINKLVKTARYDLNNCISSEDEDRRVLCKKASDMFGSLNFPTKPIEGVTYFFVMKFYLV